MQSAEPVETRPPADRAPAEQSNALPLSVDEPTHFFSLSLDLFSVTGRDGYFRQVNPAFTRTFGYTEAQLLEQPFISFVHPEDQAATAGELEGLSRGEPALEFEHRFRCREGAYRWLAWTAVPTPEGLVYAAARDVTRRRQAETERARSAAQEQAAVLADRDGFVLSASHDLGQPLTLIKGQAQLLQRLLARGETVEPERLERILGSINGSVMRAQHIIHELIDTALDQAGHPTALLLAPIDLVALARQAVGEYQLAFDLHQFVFEAEPLTFVALADGARIQRVLGNLLSNAVKYSPEGGAIRVAVTEIPSSEGAALEIVVGDDGLGIPPADVPHIFDRFHRGANVAACIAGSGLGLTSARQIVEMHGGSISVESHERRGSTFTVHLPRAPDPERSGSGADLRPARPSGAANGRAR